MTTFDAQRGIGFVRHTEGTNLVPFSSRDINGEAPGLGDSVEYTVVGGKAGVAAKQIRRIDS